MMMEIIKKRTQLEKKIDCVCVTDENSLYSVQIYLDTPHYTSSFCVGNV